ncbi:hypothetical protein M3Y95_00834700 [Aphelenchoides besseyi]|nr:hypothetical protein M3Y95_00834700 [Aphelenchoides besseyi]
MAAPNTKYLSSHRGLIKIAQIILGFILCSLLCVNWYGGRSCFGEGRLGFASGLNFVFLVINIVILILAVLDLATWRLERVISIIGLILFAVACGLMVWYVIEYNDHRQWMIVATVLIGVIAALYSYDTKILNGEASNF